MLFIQPLIIIYEVFNNMEKTDDPLKIKSEDKNTYTK